MTHCHLSCKHHQHTHLLTDFKTATKKDNALTPPQAMAKLLASCSNLEKSWKLSNARIGTIDNYIWHLKMSAYIEKLELSSLMGAQDMIQKQKSFSSTCHLFSLFILAIPVMPCFYYTKYWFLSWLTNVKILLSTCGIRKSRERDRPSLFPPRIGTIDSRVHHNACAKTHISFKT